MKKTRDPSASLEHEVIYAVIALYAGLCTVILSIHFLQPDRGKTEVPEVMTEQAAAVRGNGSVSAGKAGDGTPAR